MLLKWTLCAASAAVMLLPAGVIGILAPDLGMSILKRWTRLQTWIFGIAVTFEDRNDGRYDDPPYVFVQLNQTSLAETFILPSRIPVPYSLLMNIEYALLPFVGWCYALCGNVVVIRQAPRLARRAIDCAVRLLHRRRNLVVSIEGRRSRDGRLSPYKKGPAILAIRGRATIIPVIVRGARERLPFGAWRVEPGAASVTLCEPISTRGLSYEDRDTLIARLRALAEQDVIV
jgi:1-acyl-sn-glycerol-3-phosphate acyltransferase